MTEHRDQAAPEPAIEPSDAERGCWSDVTRIYVEYLEDLETYAFAVRDRLAAADRLAEACESAFDGIDGTGPQEFYLALAAYKSERGEH